MTAMLTLQERLDFGAASPLKAAIQALVGQDLDIDASSVSHMGTLCLQVLISASSDWAKSGHIFKISDPSDICINQLALHGFSPDTLNWNTK